MNPKGTPQNLIPGNKPISINGEELMDRWTEFNTMICQDGFTDMPTMLRFSAYTQWPVSTIYKALNREGEDYKKEFKALRSDTLAMGAAMGKYNSTMIIFCLKNWDGWTDRQEQKVEMNAHMTYEDFIRGLPDD